jgi:hypothetical protein
MEKAAVWKLSKGSLYEPARVEVEKHMQGAEAAESGAETGPWAENMLRDLLKKKTQAKIWSGGWATIAWLVMTFGSVAAQDWTSRKTSSMGVAE